MRSLHNRESGSQTLQQTHMENLPFKASRVSFWWTIMNIPLDLMKNKKINEIHLWVLFEFEWFSQILVTQQIHLFVCWIAVSHYSLWRKICTAIWNEQSDNGWKQTLYICAVWHDCVIHTLHFYEIFSMRKKNTIECYFIVYCPNTDII